MRFADSRKKQAMPYKQHKAKQHNTPSMYLCLCTSQCHIVSQICIVFVGMYMHVQVPQVEVVLLVFRRLAEDLHSQSSSSSSLTSARRKEMSAALRHQITAVFQFLLDNLEVKTQTMYKTEHQSTRQTTTLQQYMCCVSVCVCV